MSGEHGDFVPPTPIVASVLIREARTRAMLTQVELAARAGLTQSVISTYENGRREPSLVVLQRLLSAAGFRWRVELEPVAKPPSPADTVARHREELLAAFGALGGRNLRLCTASTRGVDRRGATAEVMVDLDDGCGIFSLMRMQDEAERITGLRVAVVAADSLGERARAAALQGAVTV